MNVALKRYITVCIAAIAAMTYGHAQSKSLGASYSISGLGINYEYNIYQECFINADIRAETLAVFMNRNNNPGISASLSCNFIIKEWKSRNDNSVSLFAGPGITIGMSDDFRKDLGYFFGLKGRIGAECRFDRHIAISVSLNPVIGSHLIVMEEHVEMKYYKNGLINAVLPEIGIKYIF